MSRRTSYTCSESVRVLVGEGSDIMSLSLSLSLSPPLPSPLVLGLLRDLPIPLTLLIPTDDVLALVVLTTIFPGLMPSFSVPVFYCYCDV